MLAGTLYVLKQRAVLYTKNFYVYIIYGTIASTIIDRGFQFTVFSFSYLNNIWTDTGFLIHLGFMIAPIVLLTIFHYYLINRLFDFDAKTTFKIAIVLGVLTAPWPTFFSNF